MEETLSQHNNRLIKQNEHLKRESKEWKEQAVKWQNLVPTDTHEQAKEYINRLHQQIQQLSEEREKLLKQQIDWTDLPIPKKDDNPWTPESLREFLEQARTTTQEVLDNNRTLQETLAIQNETIDDLEERLKVDTVQNQYVFEWENAGFLLFPEIKRPLPHDAVLLPGPFRERLEELIKTSAELKVSRDEAAHTAASHQTQLDEWKKVATTLHISPNPRKVNKTVKQLIEDFENLKQWPNTARRILQDNQATPQSLEQTIIRLTTMSKDGDRPKLRFSVNLPEDISTPQDLWNRLPEQWRRGRAELVTQEDANNFIQDIIFANRITEECEHPVQLAHALGQGAHTPWDQSISEVISLKSRMSLSECTHREEISQILQGDNMLPWPNAKQQIQAIVNEPYEPPEATTPTRKEFFKTSEVPTFEKRNEYLEYRNSLAMFLKGASAPGPDDFGTALWRIFPAFKDPVVQQATHAWDITPILKRTWPETIDAFLSALDKKLLSPTALEDTRQEYMKIHPEKGQMDNDFFNRFEGAVNKLRAIEKIKGVPPISEESAVLRLIAIMPNDIRNYLRLESARTNTALETMTLGELRQSTVIANAYAPRTTPTKPAIRTTPTIRINEAMRRGCGLVTEYDSQPPVETQFRGPLYPNNRMTPEQRTAAKLRNDAARKLNLCNSCRRPPHEHKATSAKHQPINQWKEFGPKISEIKVPAPPPAYETNDEPTQ